MRPTRFCTHKWVPGAVLFMAVAALAVTVWAPPEAAAQVPFRIVRPENGATVRETVRVQVPRAAVPAGGYLSITIDDRFRVALAVPPVPPGGKTQRNEQMEWDADTITFLWNTKALEPSSSPGQEAQPGQAERVIKDGPHTIEVAAIDPGGKRVGVERVAVTVTNQNLTIPSEGVPLSYRFQVGDANVYTQHTEVEYLGGRQAQTRVRRGSRAVSRGARGAFGGVGGEGGSEGGEGVPGDYPGGYPGAPGGYPGSAQPSGPFTLPVQTVDARYVRTTEDNLGDGRYFVRDKVTKGVIVAGNGTAARLEEAYALKSRYRTVTTTGRVISYGTLSASKPGAYIALPLIDLGGGRRRVGQTWQTRAPIKLEWATLDAPPMVTATNRLEALEWQDGYQTARIRQTYKGKADIPIYGGAARMQQANVEMERIIWFGYKPGKIIRMETTVTVDGDAPSNALQAMVPSAGVGGGAGAEGSGAPGFPGLSGDPEAVPEGLPGAIGGGLPGPLGGGAGGFGAVPQQQEAPKIPAKFRSVTRVALAPGAKE